MNVLLFSDSNGIHGFGREAGTYSLASALRRRGFSVRVIDFFSYLDTARLQALLDLYVGSETYLFGFSSTHVTTITPDLLEEFFLSSDNRTEHLDHWNSYFPFSAEKMREFFALMRARAPQAKIAVGGQKVLRKLQLQKTHPEVDYWIGGYAEQTLVQLVEDLAAKREPTGRRIFVNNRSAEREVFSQSCIDWSPEDFVFFGEALPLEISRGCNFDCAFCDYPKKSRAGEWTRKPEDLATHLRRNYELFGVSSYMLSDSLVNEDLSKMQMVRNLFKNAPTPIEWSGFARLDLFESQPRMLDLLLESGVRSLQLGIESINAKNHRYRLGKRFDLDVIERQLRKIRERCGREVVLGSGFILGLPADTSEDVQRLFDWLGAQNLLDAYEVCPLFIGSYHPERAEVIDFAKIQKNPKAYGYEWKMENGRENWRHLETGLSKAECVERVEEFQQSEAWERRLMANWVLYSRFRNLGFSHAQCLQSRRDNKAMMAEMVVRLKVQSQRYWSLLLGEKVAAERHGSDYLADNFLSHRT